MRLDELTALISGNLSTLHTAIAEEFVEAVKINTPVDTGFLQSSWKIKSSTQAETEIVNDADYAVYVENGTERQRAQRFTAATIMRFENVINAAIKKRGL